MKLQDVDLRKQIRLIADPEILWKSEVFAVEEPHTVEVHCPWHWKLREIQVRESPRSEEAEEVDQWVISEEEEKPGTQSSLQGVRERFEKWKKELEESILHLRKQVKSRKTLAEMAEAAFQSIQESLQSLVSVQRSQQWGKHLKTPDVFKPSNRDDEIKRWQDWKFGFMNFLSAIDTEVHALVQEVNNDPKGDYGFDEMTETVKQASLRFYGILVSYMEGRPLQMIRHVPKQNGFKAWSVLLREMEPSTRQRGLALLTQLSRVSFSEQKSISEQLPSYESLVTEYERVSQSKYPEDAKIAAILLGLPSTLRTHLQMQITETTTYESLKDKIMHYESVTTKWDSTNSLQMPTKMGSLDDAVPMEVDMVSKGKKGKGKGKKGGKGKGKGQSKGKNDDRSKGWKGNKGRQDDYQKGKGSKGKSEDKGKAKETGDASIAERRDI